jgi:hypothetical protein
MIVSRQWGGCWGGGRVKGRERGLKQRVPAKEMGHSVRAYEAHASTQPCLSC